MANVTTPSILEGVYKYIFGDGPINVIPQYTKLLKALPFESAKALGRKYIFPVIVGDEQGVTFNTDGSAFTLNDGISMATQEAEVEGVEMVFRGFISNKAISAARNDKQAFANSLALKIERLMESHARAAEYQILYGQSGARATAYTAGTSTTGAVTISDATWATGFWAGSAGMELQFYANNDSTLISTGADSIFSVVSVDYTNKKVNLSGTTQGITDLAAATYTGGGLYVYRNGAKGKEMAGIDKICTNTGSLFGIDAATYDLWKANNLTTSGALNFQKIQDAVVQAVGRGLMEDLTCYLSPGQWTKLATDQASLRKYDSSYKKDKAVNGFDSIEFYAANGKLTIEPHPMVRGGDLFMIPKDRIKRIGSSDITMERQDEKGKYFYPMTDKAGWEIRTYSDFAIIPEAPARMIKLSGFTAA